MARDFASCCSSSGTSPKNRYNNIINIHTVVEIRKGKKIKRNLRHKETITRYSILQSILWFKNKNERYNNFKP